MNPQLVEIFKQLGSALLSPLDKHDALRIIQMWPLEIGRLLIMAAGEPKNASETYVSLDNRDIAISTILQELDDFGLSK